MPKIEQNFDQNILDLISGGTVENIFDPTKGHYIRMSVYDSDNELLNIYYSNLNWNNEPVYWGNDDDVANDFYLPYNDINTQDDSTQLYFTGEPQCFDFPDRCNTIQLPIYFDVDNNIYVKPNETLNNDPNFTYGRDEYTLKFDFIDNFFNNTSLFYENAKFYLKQSSTSKKEIRLLARYDDGDNLNEILNINSIQQDFQNFILNDENQYTADVSVLLPDSINENFIGYAFDNVTDDKTSLILRFNEPISSLSILDEVQIGKEIFSTQTQKIVYISDETTSQGIQYLTPSSEGSGDTSFTDELESYNDLIGSSSFTNEQKTTILNSIFSSSYENININFSDLNNHTFFGSAEYKLRNFHKKITNIQTHYNTISSSFSFTSSGIVEDRKRLFKKINDIKQNFTPYENWLFNDYTSRYSFPKAGFDYAKIPPITGSFNDDLKTINGNATILRDYNGIDVVYKIDSHGEEAVLSGSFTSASAASATYGIDSYWYTGSHDLESGGTDVAYWKLSNDKAFFHQQQAGSNSNGVKSMYQVSPDGNLEQFENAKTYVVKFNVVDKENDGKLIFQFGPTGDTLDFEIDSTGAKKGLKTISAPDGGYNTSNNYLLIFGANDSNGSLFSGSIDNVSVRESKDTDGRNDMFTGKYKVEDYPMSHYNGPFYLSFLAKWQEFPTWENHNTSESLQTTFRTPVSAFNSESIINPIETNPVGYDSGSYQRYILASSQSYWRPADGVENLSETDAHDSTKWEILSGSGVSSSIDLEFSYDVSNTEDVYGSYIVHNSHSILPSNELFRLYQRLVTDEGNELDVESPVTSSLLTDIHIYKKDELYGGSITDTTWFSSLYSVTSSIVKNWYDEQLISASKYDKENIYSLYNSLPDHVRKGDTNYVMKKYLALLGENYDVLKQHIDNYLNFNSREYSVYDSVPSNLLQLVGDNLGWSFLNDDSVQSLLKYYVGEESVDFNYKNLTQTIWRNILNNLIYIYKSKGTENSVRALLNSFGLPPNIITVNEFGGSTDTMIQSSPGEINLLSTNGLDSEVGNISFDKYTDRLQLLNFGSNNNSFTSDWNTSNTGLTTGVEFILSVHSGSRERQDILLSSGSLSQSFWSLQLKDNPSNNNTQVIFRLNHESPLNATSSLEGLVSGNLRNNVHVLTTTIEPSIFDTTNRKLYHILLQRTGTLPTASYELHVGTRFNIFGNMTDSIQSYNSSSLVVTGGNAHANFTSSGVPVVSSDNLYLGRDFTGSISEFRTYGTSSMSQSNFLTHIFEPKSVVGNKVDSYNNVVYRYNFNNVSNTNTFIQDVTGNNSYGDFGKVLPSSFTNPTFRTQKVTSYQFNARNIDPLNVVNKKKITIQKDSEVVLNYLDPYKSSFISDFDTDELQNQTRYSMNALGLSVSYTNQINRLIQSHISDKDLGQFLFDDSETTYYSELKKINDEILNQYQDLSFNFNKYVKTLSKVLPTSITNYLKNRIFPESINSSLMGIEISNPITERNRWDINLDKSVEGLSPGAESGLFQYDKFGNLMQKESIDFIPEINSILQNQLISNKIKLDENIHSISDDSEISLNLNDNLILLSDKMSSNIQNIFEDEINRIIDQIYEISSENNSVNYFNITSYDDFVNQNVDFINSVDGFLLSKSKNLNLSSYKTGNLNHLISPSLTIQNLLNSNESLVRIDKTEKIKTNDTEITLLIKDIKTNIESILESKNNLKKFDDDKIKVIGDLIMQSNAVSKLKYLINGSYVDYSNDTVETFVTNLLTYYSINLNKVEEVGIDTLFELCFETNVINLLSGDKIFSFINKILTSNTSISKSKIKNLETIFSNVLISEAVAKLEKNKFDTLIESILTSDVISKIKVSNMNALLSKVLFSNVITKISVTQFSGLIENALVLSTLEKLESHKLDAEITKILFSNYLQKIKEMKNLNVEIGNIKELVLDYGYDISLDFALNYIVDLPASPKDLYNITSEQFRFLEIDKWEKHKFTDFKVEKINVFGDKPFKNIVATENLNKFNTHKSSLYGYTSSLYTKDLQFEKTNVSSQIFTDFARTEVLTKYVDPTDTNHKVLPKMGFEKDFPSGSFYETSYLGRFIGDTERINMLDKSWGARGKSFGTGSAPGFNRIKLKLQEGGGTFIEGHKHDGWFEPDRYLDWDPTSHQIFSSRFRDPENRHMTIGRTARVDIDYQTGKITYPEHHVRRHWGGYLVDHLYRGSTFDGYIKYWNVPDDPNALSSSLEQRENLIKPYIPYDEEGAIPEKAAAVFSIDVEKGKSKARLKVENRGKDKKRKNK